jgi:hypothetical protein
MPVGSAVEAAGLIAKRKLENEAVFSQEVECPVDSTERNSRVAHLDTLVDLRRGKVRMGFSHLV